MGKIIFWIAVCFIVKELASFIYYHDYYINNIYHFMPSDRDIPYNHRYNYNKVIRMDWKTIKDTYAICPDRWAWVSNEDLVVYNGNQDKLTWKQETTVCVIIPYRNWRRRRKYLKEYEKNQRRNEEVKDTQFFIQSVQSDIDKMKKLAQSQVDEANKMMEKVILQ